MGQGPIGNTQSAAQKAFEDYQRRKNSHRQEEKAEEAKEEQKSRDILQEFRDKPRPATLPHACEVVPGVWLGSLYDAMDAEYIEREHITHAVVCKLIKDPFSGKVHRFLAIVDDEDPGDIWKLFERVCDNIDGVLQEGGRVLVHCEWGIGRSPTLVAAYLMRSQRRTADSCLDELKGLRDCVRPNNRFLGALKEWQETLRIEAPAEEEVENEEEDQSPTKEEVETPKEIEESKKEVEKEAEKEAEDSKEEAGASQDELTAAEEKPCEATTPEKLIEDDGAAPQALHLPLEKQISQGALRIMEETLSRDAKDSPASPMSPTSIKDLSTEEEGAPSGEGEALGKDEVPKQNAVP